MLVASVKVSLCVDLMMQIAVRIMVRATMKADTTTIIMISVVTSSINLLSSSLLVSIND